MKSKLLKYARSLDEKVKPGDCIRVAFVVLEQLKPSNIKDNVLKLRKEEEENV